MTSLMFYYMWWIFFLFWIYWIFFINWFFNYCCWYNLIKFLTELMILGFISLILAVSQGLISRMCIPSHLADYMLPCKLSTASSENEHYSYFLHQTTTLNNWPRRHLLSGDSAASDHCTRKVYLYRHTYRGN